MREYIVDAFTKEVFRGNPAAVVVLEKSLSDNLMQSIAIENNLSETAYAEKLEDGLYSLRWFTPGGEVSLCGHATLATAFVIFNYYDKEREVIRFETLSGILTVKKDGDLFQMDFPALTMEKIEITEEIVKAIGIRPKEVYKGEDILCILDSEDDVYSTKPDLDLIEGLDALCLHVSAKGREYDSVTRTFAPRCKVKEDPVCGRAHTHIVPLLSKKTNKNKFTCYQGSKRGGVLYCEYDLGRVKISGNAALFSISEIYVR